MILVNLAAMYASMLLMPRLHEQILFDKFNVTNAYDQKLAC